MIVDTGKLAAKIRVTRDPNWKQVERRIRCPMQSNRTPMYKSGKRVYRDKKNIPMRRNDKHKAK